MCVRVTMWDQTIELGGFDHWVITARPLWAIKHWLDDGLIHVPEERIGQAIRAALNEVREQDVPSLWHQLFEYGGAPPDSVDALASELIWEARGSVPRLIVLERLIERGFRFEPLVWNFRPPPARTETEHFVVVHAVDTEQRPVPRLQLELLIADGEVRPAQTDAEGVARVDRICAGRVVIRVLGVDGARWRPLDGEDAQPSGERAGLRWHSVRQGECLSRIADRYGLRSWHELWDHPKNEPLRRRRGNPHVLYPGDQVAVPGPNIYEIVRPTDATHRIEIDAAAETTLRLRLADLALEPFDGVEYELHYLSGDHAMARPGRAPTDDGGWLEETVPLLARDLVIHLLKPPLSFPVALAHLDPVQDEASKEPHFSGVAQRLAALGYAAGPGRDPSDAGMRAALCAFQADQLGRDTPSGEPDAETLAALTRIYGA